MTVTNAAGATISETSDNLTVKKSYATTTGVGQASSISNHLFTSGDASTTPGLISDGTVISDMTWTLAISQNVYPGDYTNIPNGSNVTTTDSGTELEITVPDTVKIDSAHWITV